jgi:SAM-dependent methyltransferase
MNEPRKPKYATTAAWEDAYRKGTPPWDAGKPHAELLRVLDEKHFTSGSLLELGCGTGADCVYLASRRFDVTAIDCSPIALERARGRAEQQDALLRFVLGDAFEFAQTSEQFDIVYDSGFYHCARLVNLEKYLDMLWRVTHPGSFYFCLAGAIREESEEGPPQVSEDDIHNELGRLFELVQLRPTRLECAEKKEGYPAWSCLMRRPNATGK